MHPTCNKLDNTAYYKTELSLGILEIFCSNLVDIHLHLPTT